MKIEVDLIYIVGTRLILSGEWLWHIHTDVDTSEYQEPLWGTTHYASEAGMEAAKAVASLNHWYWDRQQQKLF